VTGKNTKGAVIRYLAEVHEKCVKEGISALLIEENLEGKSLGAFDVYDVVRQGSKVVRPILKSIAFVDVNPEHDREVMKFAQTVAVNRLVNMRVFTSVGEAGRWLDELAKVEGAGSAG